MDLQNKYNLKSPGVKRLMREARELSEATEEYFAHPLEDNLFEWHFTVRGPPNTEFEGGVYHGRILLPSQYPMQPPNIILLTPNGRFEVNKKICLSISGHHPESWQPSWSIRTALLALIAFMPTPAAGTIASLDYTPEERRILARKSLNWVCDDCGKISDKLFLQSTSTSSLTSEEVNLIQTISLKGENKSEECATINSEYGKTDNININNEPNGSIMTPHVENSSSITEAAVYTSHPGTLDHFFQVIIIVVVSAIVLLIGRRFFILE